MVWKRTAGLALAATLAACSPSPPEKVVHDLVALLPVAEVRRASTQPRAGRGSVFLPFGAEVDYYLDLAGESELSTTGLSVRGATAASLKVTAQVEGEAERLLERIEAGTGAATVELPGEGRRLLRLALRVEPADGPRAGGVLVSRPAVSSVASEAEAPEPAPRRQTRARPNVLIYLVDTLRADRLGCYGYPRPVSPHLDRFAQGATLFETAIAQAPWTRPSVASVLTGLGPLAHGVRTLDDRLPSAVETLGERLRAAGYRTAAFSTNWHISADTGFDQGFDDFDFLPQEPDSGPLNRRVLAWLDRQQGPEPLFLYVHALDPHAPYTPPPDLRRRFAPEARPQAGSLASLRRIYAVRGPRRLERIAEVSPLYDAEIAANDRSFGALLAALRQRGLFDDTLIVFVSDHGEEFGEHGGFGHARNLFSEVLNVPLVVKLPFQTRGERASRLAQHVDLVPTVLAAAGLPPATGLPGADLFAPGGSDAAAFSHLSYRGREGMSVVQGEWKRIEPWSRKLGPRPALFRGGDEYEDLAAGNPVRDGFLASLLRGEVLRGRRGLRPEQAGMDEETRRQLEALGYL